MYEKIAESLVKTLSGSLIANFVSGDSTARQSLTNAIKPCISAVSGILIWGAIKPVFEQFNSKKFDKLVYIFTDYTECDAFQVWFRSDRDRIQKYFLHQYSGNGIWVIIPEYTGGASKDIELKIDWNAMADSHKNSKYYLKYQNKHKEWGML